MYNLDINKNSVVSVQKLQVILLVETGTKFEHGLDGAKWWRKSVD